MDKLKLVRDFHFNLRRKTPTKPKGFYILFFQLIKEIPLNNI